MHEQSMRSSPRPRDVELRAAGRQMLSCFPGMKCTERCAKSLHQIKIAYWD